MKRFIPLLICSWLVFGLFGCSTSNHYKGQGDPSASKASRSAERGECGALYVVKWGDTLSEIAVRCGVTMEALAEANHLDPPYRIYVRQELVMPQVGRTFSADRSSKVRPKAQANTSAAPSRVSLAWPVRQASPYRFVRDSRGLNSLVIDGTVGEGVHAMANGEVVYAGDGIRQYGNMVVIRHDNGYLTVYAHNDSLQVKEGQRVKKGQLIATLGQTGTAKKPELFVEARYRGKKVDIKPLLKLTQASP